MIFIQAAQELKLDEDLLTEVKEKFDLLNPLQITQSGRIREWYEEEEQHFQNEKVEVPTSSRFSSGGTLSWNSL